MPQLPTLLGAATATAVRMRGVTAIVFVIVVVGLIAVATYLVLRRRRRRAAPPDDDWPQNRTQHGPKDQPWP